MVSNKEARPTLKNSVGSSYAAHPRNDLRVRVVRLEWTLALSPLELRATHNDPTHVVAAPIIERVATRLASTTNPLPRSAGALGATAER